MKGQLSAEMLILIVVLLAVVALVSTQLFKTGQKLGTQIDSGTDVLIDSSKTCAYKDEYCSTRVLCCSGDICPTSGKCD
ncbi:MAG: hypothetical protein AABX38_04450 [Candidatus Micrarchaeota archaeon]